MMSSSQERWNTYFMKMAQLVASKSKDEGIKVGCVITQGNTVSSTGYNGFPRGVDEEVLPARNERPEKYFWTEHAERNAVYNAAYNGAKLCYSVAYSTAHPCVECARAFIQSGVMEIYVPKKENDPFYNSPSGGEEHITKAREILDAAGVIVHVV